ncbi:MAG: hypothetical protein PVG89_05740 [Gammaproteobacteria bacterium]|jgi:hypothetical protein
MMLLVDSETLAKQYVKGYLSKARFVSLSESVAEIEAAKNSGNVFDKTIALFRCPGELWRYSIKWRAKRIWNLFKYSVLACLALLMAVFYRVDVADVRYVLDSGGGVQQIAALIIEGSPEALPDDVRQAAEYMAAATQWKGQHIRQFKAMWTGMQKQERQAIKKTHWFKTFYLIALLKDAEGKKAAMGSGDGAFRNASEIHSLVSQLS